MTKDDIPAWLRKQLEQTGGWDLVERVERYNVYLKGGARIMLIMPEYDTSPGQATVVCRCGAWVANLHELWDTLPQIDWLGITMCRGTLKEHQYVQPT